MCLEIAGESHKSIRGFTQKLAGEIREGLVLHAEGSHQGMEMCYNYLRQEEEVMFLLPFVCLFVCLFVSKITPKVVNRF